METKTVNLKVTVTQNRTMFGKRRESFTASLGDTGWEAEGTCREGALQLLAHDLTQAKANEMRRYYVRAQGATFALYWAGAGWCYDIILDSNPNRPCISMCGHSVTFEQAKASVDSHAAQYIAEAA